MEKDEYHVASFVVRTRPEDAAMVAARISLNMGLEVHASEQGKLVVTAEAGSTRGLARPVVGLILDDKPRSVVTVGINLDLLRQR